MWFAIVPVPCGTKSASVSWAHTLEGRPTPNGGEQPPAGLGPSDPIVWIFQLRFRILDNIPCRSVRKDFEKELSQNVEK